MDEEAMRADIQEYMAMALSSVDLAKSYAVIISEANRQLEVLMEDMRKNGN